MRPAHGLPSVGGGVVQERREVAHRPAGRSRRPGRCWSGRPPRRPCPARSRRPARCTTASGTGSPPSSRAKRQRSRGIVVRSPPGQSRTVRLGVRIVQIGGGVRLVDAVRQQLVVGRRRSAGTRRPSGPTIGWPSSRAPGAPPGPSGRRRGRRPTASRTRRPSSRAASGSRRRGRSPSAGHGGGGRAVEVAHGRSCGRD